MSSGFLITRTLYAQVEGGRTGSKEAGVPILREHHALRSQITHYLTEPAASITELRNAIQKLGYTFEVEKAVRATDGTAHAHRTNTLRVPITKNGRDICTITIGFSDVAEQEEEQQLQSVTSTEASPTGLLALEWIKNRFTQPEVQSGLVDALLKNYDTLSNEGKIALLKALKKSSINFLSRIKANVVTSNLDTTTFIDAFLYEVGDEVEQLRIQVNDNDGTEFPINGIRVQAISSRKAQPGSEVTLTMSAPFSDEAFLELHRILGA